MSKNIVIFGASSGLGLYLFKKIPEKGDVVYTVSRKKPPNKIIPSDYKHFHITADLSDINSAYKIAKEISSKKIDILIYCSGTWELSPIRKISPDEIQEIINVNLSSFIANVIYLNNKLQLAKGKVIAIGSTSGLENAVVGGPVYAASKFGLRGAIHGFRPLLSEMGIGCSVINVGSFNISDGEENGRIDPYEILNIINMIYRSGPSPCIKEIDLPTMSQSKNGV